LNVLKIAFQKIAVKIFVTEMCLLFLRSFPLIGKNKRARKTWETGVEFFMIFLVNIFISPIRSLIGFGKNISGGAFFANQNFLEIRKVKWVFGCEKFFNTLISSK